jgi:hypothetical protein
MTFEKEVFLEIKISAGIHAVPRLTDDSQTRRRLLGKRRPARHALTAMSSLTTPFRAVDERKHLCYMGIVVDQRRAQVRYVIAEGCITPPEVITNLGVFQAREVELDDHQIAFRFAVCGWQGCQEGGAARGDPRHPGRPAGARIRARQS